MRNDGWDGQAAYGAMLGTSMVCCLSELFFSFMPIAYIKRLFPPLITSITVVLLGIALCGTGMKYWGGGTVCAEMGWKIHAQLVDAGITDLPPPSALCNNGETSLYYGTAAYIGLGFSVLCSLVVIELFGSVFMKNCNVIIALCIGYIIAAVTSYNGIRYVTRDNIEAAPVITFLWVYTFPLSIYGPAVIPLLIGYLVTTVETVGDLSATFEASQLPTEGEFYNTSLQGGLTSDAFGSILSGLFTSMPNTTFSQNNGVISMTKCASRRAGYGAAFWMFILGVFGKFAGKLLSC
jgi:uric acid-xanthine permease